VKRIKQEKADLGMAFDGDGDRVFFVDNNGELLTASFMGAMIAKRILKQYPGSNIIYNLVSSKIVPDTIEQYGGKPIIWKVGHALIKKQMREKDAPFGAEHSGHYYFRDFFYADSGLIASLVMLEIISDSGKPLSELKKEYAKYATIEETNFKVADKEKKLSEIRKNHSDAKKILDMDGLSFYYSDWWFNVRPSNTEPLLRLNMEANTPQRLEEMKAKLIKEIQS
jgi:phosphomannomutase